MLVATNGIVNVGDEPLAFEDIVRRMVVRGTRLIIRRLDEAVLRKVLSVAAGVAKEFRQLGIMYRVFRLQLVNQDERLRDVAIVDAPLDLLLVQAIVKRGLVVPMKVGVEDAFRHGYAADRGSGMRKKRLGQVGPGSEENHLSQTAKLFAKACNAGSVPSAKFS